MRDTTDAHFLHQRSGLESVLRPPVPAPTALAWVPGREELVAGTRDGAIFIVDPVLGTRQLVDGLAPVHVLSVHPDRKRYFTASEKGKWAVGKLAGGVEHEGRHPFVRHLVGFWLGEYAVLTGEGAKGYSVILYQDGQLKASIDIPERAIPLIGENGKLNLARSMGAGLDVVPLGRNTTYAATETTAHVLQPSGNNVLGFTTTGVAIWPRTGGMPRSMRLPDVTAGDVTVNGNFVGFGARSGAVALATLHTLDGRIRPHLVKAFEQPVSTVAFSSRGRWLAAGAEGLRIFTWDDPDPTKVLE